MFSFLPLLLLGWHCGAAVAYADQDAGVARYEAALRAKFCGGPSGSNRTEDNDDEDVDDDEEHDPGFNITKQPPRPHNASYGVIDIIAPNPNRFAANNDVQEAVARALAEVVGVPRAQVWLLLAVERDLVNTNFWVASSNITRRTAIVKSLDSCWRWKVVEGINRRVDKKFKGVYLPDQAVGSSSSSRSRSSSGSGDDGRRRRRSLLSIADSSSDVRPGPAKIARQADSTVYGSLALKVPLPASELPGELPWPKEAASTKAAVAKLANAKDAVVSLFQEKQFLRIDFQVPFDQGAGRQTFIKTVAENGGRDLANGICSAIGKFRLCRVPDDSELEERSA